MAVYRKRPIDVEMYQWNGDLDAILAWADDLYARGINHRTLVWSRPSDWQTSGEFSFFVEKGQSECTIRPADWIAAEGDGGGYYPIEHAAQQVGYEPILPQTVDFGADERAFTLLARLMEADSDIGNADADWLCGWIQRQRS